MNESGFSYSASVQDPWTLEVTRELSVNEDCMELLGRWLAVHDAGRVLDMGCGTGTMLRKLLQRFPEITAVGVDADRAYIEEARRLAAAAGLASRLEFEVADVRALTCPDRSFDAIFCHAVLQIVRDGRKALDEVVRVVKPHGRVVLMLPIIECPHPVVAERFPRREQLEQLEAEVFCQNDDELERWFATDTTITWRNARASAEAAGLRHVLTRGLFCPLDVDALDSEEFSSFVRKEALVLRERARRLLPGHPRLNDLEVLNDARAEWLIEQRDAGKRSYGWSGVPLLVLVCRVEQ